jgi:hypothetical protein
MDVLKNIDGVIERIHDHLKIPYPPLKRGQDLKKGLP